VTGRRGAATSACSQLLSQLLENKCYIPQAKVDSSITVLIEEARCVLLRPKVSMLGIRINLGTVLHLATASPTTPQLPPHNTSQWPLHLSSYCLSAYRNFRPVAAGTV
jgi:hypothetical protein